MEGAHRLGEVTVERRALLCQSQEAAIVAPGDREAVRDARAPCQQVRDERIVKMIEGRLGTRQDARAQSPGAHHAGHRRRRAALGKAAPGRAMAERAIGMDGPS
jgi:hypothetical protein